MTESSPLLHLKPRIKRIVKSEIDTTQELLDRDSYELWKRVRGRVWDPRDAKFRNKPTSDLKWTEKGTKSNPFRYPPRLLSYPTLPTSYSFIVISKHFENETLIGKAVFQIYM